MEEPPISQEHITKIRIPDSDVSGWINSLREGGDLGQEQIDGILARLNETYADLKGVIKEKVEQELLEFQGFLGKRYGRIMDPEQAAQVRKIIEDRIRSEY